jgi:hypothetical protein
LALLLLACPSLAGLPLFYLGVIGGREFPFKASLAKPLLACPLFGGLQLFYLVVTIAREFPFKGVFSYLDVTIV